MSRIKELVYDAVESDVRAGYSFDVTNGTYDVSISETDDIYKVELLSRNFHVESKTEEFDYLDEAFEVFYEWVQDVDLHNA